MHPGLEGGNALKDRSGLNEIGFILIGGEHQLLHIVPVAAALSHVRDVSVTLFAATEELAATASHLMRRLDSGAFDLTVMRLPRLLETWHDSGANLKLLRLLRYQSALRACTALVAAERTSTALRRLPGHCPVMIHLRHGAGDRAVGFERRIALFDHLVVAGAKDRRRVIEEGLLPADRCHAVGYIKLSTLRRLHARAPQLFDNGLPVVLYNPHFEPRMSSLAHARTIIQGIAAAGDFNLIVAPHVRLFANLGAAARSEWESLAIAGRVLVDLGSPRSSDMTYTLAADIYLGDVSSQIYEFLSEPRPCVFLNTHAVPWQADPNYRMWEMGEVVQGSEEVVEGLRRAASLHISRYLDVQRRIVRETLGEAGPGCAERAAQVILDSLEARVTRADCVVRT